VNTDRLVVTGEPAHVALGTHANEQGRIAGSVIGGPPASPASWGRR
jgi:hypothetical protein